MAAMGVAAINGVRDGDVGCDRRAFGASQETLIDLETDRARELRANVWFAGRTQQRLSHGSHAPAFTRVRSEAKSARSRLVHGSTLVLGSR